MLGKFNAANCIGLVLETFTEVICGDVNCDIALHAGCVRDTFHPSEPPIGGHKDLVGARPSPEDSDMGNEFSYAS